MSLSKAVKFQYLANQLTQNETHFFINKLFETHPKYIQMGLFYYILNTLHNNESNNINELVSNIIQSRKKKPKQTTKQNIKLDSIPKPLIGVIASFMSQFDYIDFSKCNRYIYLGCNTPNLLQELYLYERDHSSVNLSLYPSITYLKLNLNEVNKLMINTSSNNAPIINQLEYLNLNADKRNDCDINGFLTQNTINTNTVTELTLNLFGKSYNKFDAIKLMQLLNKLPNINYLNFNGVYSDFDPNDIKTLYPNLKGLSLFMCNHQTNMSLLHLFAFNLKYLGLHEYTIDTDYHMDTFIFSKLEELRLSRPRIKSIDSILKTAINLQRISIQTTHNNSCFISSNETETTIKKLIISCKSLKYIHFKDEGNLFESILNGIEKGLFLTTKWNRKQMKICIQITKPLIDNDNNKFSVIIRKIINWLEQSNINDFMFILGLNGINKNEIFTGLKDNISSNIKVTKDLLVFTSKKCNINGYTEQWNVKIKWVMNL